MAPSKVGDLMLHMHMFMVRVYNRTSQTQPAKYHDLSVG